MPELLTPEQVVELKQAHRAIKDKKIADRIKAVLSLNEGFPSSQVAKILLLDEITLRRYVKRYQEEGVAGLLQLHYTGGQSFLTSMQEGELKKHLHQNTYLKAKEVEA